MTILKDGSQEIRFGIMCNDTVFYAWQADSILELVSHDNVTCRLKIIENCPPTPGRRKMKYLLWFGYNRLSTKLSRAMRKVDLTRELEAVPEIQFGTGNSQREMEMIRQADLYFILRFGSGPVTGKILDAPRFGVWSFWHDDPRKYRGGPPAFWEIYKDDKVTGAVLQRLRDQPHTGVILKKGFTRTRYSYAGNRDQIYKESSRWPAMLCTDILNGHTDQFHQPADETKPCEYQNPRNRQVLVFLCKLALFNLRESVRTLIFTDYWNIGVASAPISAFLDEEKPEVEWYPLRSRNRFLADPFCFADEADKHKLHIFYETYPFMEARGKLDYIMFDGSFGEEQKIIKERFHLSYPYPVKYKGDLYLVPESYEANRVFMYRAIDFPLSWERSHILLEGFAGIDNTIIKHDDTYWLFTTDKKDGFRHNLKLFYTDDLLARWTAHPQNPVKTDIRSARPAGTPFFHKGHWYRPSMDYAQKIEGRIRINKVLKLSRTEYEEIVVKIIDPYKDTRFSDKIHTLCEAGEYTIVDGGKEAIIFGSFYFVLHKIIKVVKTLKVKF